MAINLDALVISIIIRIIVLAPVLWISGRILVGGQKAKSTDAIWIVVLGTLIGSFFEFFFSGIIATIIVLFIWLALIKHFFDCGWLKALAISILAIVIFVIIAVVLTLIGIAIWSFTSLFSL